MVLQFYKLLGPFQRMERGKNVEKIQNLVFKVNAKDSRMKDL
jgi:hypothetical protein